MEQLGYRSEEYLNRLEQPSTGIHKRHLSLIRGKGYNELLVQIIYKIGM